MTNFSLPKKVLIPEEVLFQEIEGEGVLLNLKNEQYFGLNEMGTRIWHLLSENGLPENALVRLQKEYKIDEDTLRVDLAELIAELNRQGLVSTED
ncbi:MAG: PqqD family protein [Pyrinomonadaceae bacterium]